VIWLFVCVILSVAGVRRQGLVLSCVLILRLVIPSQAGGLVIGDWAGSSAIHPGTILLLVYGAISALHNREHVGRELAKYPGIYGSVLFVSTIFVAVSVVESGPTSLLGLSNAVLSGFVFLFVCRIEEQARPGTTRRLILVFLTAMVGISLLVAGQAALGSNLPWGARIGSAYTLTGATFRPLGTFDSPLDLGYAAAIAVPFFALVQRPLLRFGGAGFMLLAVVLSESRAPTLVAVIGVAILVLTTVRSATALVAVGVAVASGLLVVTYTGVLAGLIERFSVDDGNSSTAREAATRYSQEHLLDHAVFGGGWGSAYRLVGTVLKTSLENSYAILAFDLGLAFVIVLLLLQLRLILMRGSLPGAKVGAISGIVLAFLFSGLVNMGAAPTILWLALCACMPSSRSAGTTTAPSSEAGSSRPMKTPVAGAVR
jgi:drug/metabolite transporter superfamily protein YnfA